MNFETLVVKKDKIAGLNDVLRMLVNCDVITLDTETTGFNSYKADYPFLLQIGAEIDGVYYVFLFCLEEFGQGEDVIPKEAILSEGEKRLVAKFLNFFFSVPTNKIIAHNLKFDMHQVLNYFFKPCEYKKSSDIACELIDTYALSKLIKNNMPVNGYSLKALSSYYKLDLQKSDVLEEWLSKRSNKTSIQRTEKRTKAETAIVRVSTGKQEKPYSERYDLIPASLMLDYSATDVKATYDLYQTLGKEIMTLVESKTVKKELFKKCVEREIKTTKVLLFMERRGIKIDLEHLKKCSQYYQMQMLDLELQYFTLTGEDFVDSADHIAPLFKKLYKITLPKGGASGKPITAKGQLVKYDNEMSKLILKMRTIKKYCSTYISNIEKDVVDGRVYPTYFQCGADTLRMSSNLMQVFPREVENMEYDLRAIVIPEDDKALYSVDYQAMEARLTFHLAKEQKFIDLIKKGEDFHQYNADILKVSRSVAKGTFFGICYGEGAALLSSNLGIKIDEAYKVKSGFNNSMPNVMKYNKFLIKCCEENGYVVTALGNPLFQDNKNFSYKSLNQVIQGSCAQIFKECLILWDIEANKVNDFYPIIPLHDEIISCSRYMQNIPKHIQEKFLDCFRKSFEFMDAEFSPAMLKWRKC